MLVTIGMATARLSGVFVALCDRAGEERGQEFEGESVIVGPRGWILAGPMPRGEAGLVSADCELSQADSKRIGEWNDLFADRRPDLYGL